MVEPIIPAGTPPVVPGGQPATPPVQTPVPANNPPGNTPAPIQPPAPTQNSPVAEFILTQDQFNARWGEKMAGLEKDLGMTIAEAKTLAEKSKKPPAPVLSNDPMAGAELRLAKMESLMLAGVPSKKIPGLLSRVQGKTKADIEADIQQMIADGFLIIEEPNVAQPPQLPASQVQGAGNPGVPPGPKTWSKAEIAGLTPEQHEKHRLDIMAAMQDGRVK